MITIDKRPKMLVALAVAGSLVSGCSMAELAQFNADLDDYGLVYEDMGPTEQRLPCAAGGHLVAISQITDSRASLNVVNRGRRQARVEVLVGGEVIHDWRLAAGGRSTTFYHSPRLTIEFETTC
jgi:hypothetical protein